MSKNRVLVLGLDGATLDLVKPFIQKGLLPNINMIMENGSNAELDTVYPVISAAAWTTFMTGVNPGKHGIYDFIYRDKDSYKLKPTTQLNNHAPTLWNILSQQNKRVLVFNVPLTYPPETVNGILVSGLGTPRYKPFTYPQHLSETLVKNGYRVNRKFYYSPKNEDEFLKETFSRIKHFSSVFLEMLAYEKWDFSMFVFRETDEICHYFWHYMDRTHPKYIYSEKYQNIIKLVYQEIDHIIGEIISIVGNNTTIFVMSDHGFGPLYKDVFLNNWLQKEKFISTKNYLIHKKLLGKFGITRSNISTKLRSLHLEKIERVIKDILKENIYLIPKSKHGDISDTFDWKNTIAYSFGFQGQIYINLKGREPNGIISPGNDYKFIVEKIISLLSNLIDPQDGKKIIDRVFRGADLFHGNHSINAPDIILIMRDLSYITRLWNEIGGKSDEIITDNTSHETGTHRYKGMILASGASIKISKDSSPIWIGDLMPTILHILGCEIPKWVDGKVIKEWLNDEYSNKPINYSNTEFINPLRNSNKLNQSDEKYLMDRLIDLGYLG